MPKSNHKLEINDLDDIKFYIRLGYTVLFRDGNGHKARVITSSNGYFIQIGTPSGITFRSIPLTWSDGKTLTYSADLFAVEIGKTNDN